MVKLKQFCSSPAATIISGSSAAAHGCISSQFPRLTSQQTRYLQRSSSGLIPGQICTQLTTRLKMTPKQTQLDVAFQFAIRHYSFSEKLYNSFGSCQNGDAPHWLDTALRLVQAALVMADKEVFWDAAGNFISFRKNRDKAWIIGMSNLVKVIWL